MHPWRLTDLTYTDTESKDFEVAVLGFGAIEPHGSHLPHGTDYLETDFIVDRACRIAYQHKAKVMMLPTFPYGVHGNQMAINVHQTFIF